VRPLIINPVTEDRYELGPMQQGMLFDTLQAESPDVYCMLVAYTLRGPLDRAAFRAAWQHVVARHAILRTSFEWHEHREPSQIVHAEAALEVQEHDWSGEGASDQDERLRALLRAESRRGFDLRQPPLMRLCLIRCAPDLHRLVIAQHHILMDGSCKPLLFQEAFTCYDAIRSGHAPQLPPARPYRDYIEWVREQDITAAEAYWQAELADFAEPTPLWADGLAAASDEEYQQHESLLGEVKTEALRLTARRSRLTLNTMLTGIWALQLAHASQRDDVVVGTTVNGRPALPGVDTMLGLFINTLPLRVRVSPDMAMSTWLRTIQISLATARDYDFTPLWRIQRCSAIPRGRPLFESIVVFENNPGYGSDDHERYGDVAITAVQPFTRNSLPLTLRGVPGRNLAIQLLYDTRRFSSETIHRAADQMTDALRELAEGIDQPVRHYLGRFQQLIEQRDADAASTYYTRRADMLRRLKRDGRTRNL
jgi:hypothetical protein